MTDVDIVRNEIADPQVAHQVVSEIVAAAAAAVGHAHDVVACSILDEGRHFEIEVEVPGWTERLSVPSPARPGAVRGAVAKMLRDLGLATD